MPFCSNCGVKVNDNCKECPLCFTPIYHIEEPKGKNDKPYPRTKKLRRFTPKEKLFFIWLPIAAALFAALFIVIFINLHQGGFTWSRYPVISLGATILLLTGGFLFAKRPIVYLVWISATLLGYLYILDLLTGTPRWFTPIGMPIVLYCTACTLPLIMFRVFLKEHISFLFLSVSIIIGAFAPFLEFVIIQFAKKDGLSWSIIVTIVFASIATVLLTYILFVKKRVDITKYFHT